MRGAKVIGLDQFEEGHGLGASAGRTRIVRQAYFEDAAYVPLIRRSYELWREVERLTATELLRLTGLLTAGPPQSEVVQGTLHAAREHDLPIETLELRDLERRYPDVTFASDELGIFEQNAGYISPEAAIAAHLRIARANGATLHFGAQIQAWQTGAYGVRVLCKDESTIEARRLILGLGPWFAREMMRAGVDLRVQRNVQVWFTPRDARYDAARFPAFLLDRHGLPAMLYGFPDTGDGVKAAFHGWGVETTPQALKRDIDQADDIEPVRRALESWMPGAAAQYRDAKACMYALTPDKNFVIGAHPLDGNVILCGGFSGHGFKFAAVVGEIASQLALDRGTPHDIAFLSPQRFR